MGILGAKSVTGIKHQNLTPQILDANVKLKPPLLPDANKCAERKIKNRYKVSNSVSQVHVSVGVVASESRKITNLPFK
jgi:hypothetical protein